MCLCAGEVVRGEKIRLGPAPTHRSLKPQDSKNKQRWSLFVPNRPSEGNAYHPLDIVIQFFYLYRKLINSVTHDNL